MKGSEIYERGLYRYARFERQADGSTVILIDENNLIEEGETKLKKLGKPLRLKLDKDGKVLEDEDRAPA